MAPYFENKLWDYKDGGLKDGSKNYIDIIIYCYIFRYDFIYI